MPLKEPTDDVFRFMELRSPSARRARRFQLPDTNHSAALAGLGRVSERRRFANERFAEGHLPRAPNPAGLQILAAVDAHLDECPDSTVGELRQALYPLASAFRSIALHSLIDSLILGPFSAVSPAVDLRALGRLFIVTQLVAPDSLREVPAELRAADVLDWAIVLPFDTGFRLRLVDVTDPYEGDALVSAEGVQPVGVGRLRVVKQHIKAYQALEIAHIENVMEGETRERTHRTLQRTEIELVSEREEETEKVTELETAERFELSTESERTLREDAKFSAGLSISGKYGPSVEFSSNVQAEYSRTEEQSARSASEYAREITSRSLERIKSRIRQQRTTRVLRETEEMNLHRFEGSTAHTVGVYQFVDKVYEAQVFDYGVRMMFDVLVPEPAAYLLHLTQQPDPDVGPMPTPPRRLDEELSSLSELTAERAFQLATQYGASGLEPYPQEELVVSQTRTHPTDPSSSIESGAGVLELTIPDQYEPVRARVKLVMLSDNTDNNQGPWIGLTLGTDTPLWKSEGAAIPGINETSNRVIGSRSISESSVEFTSEFAGITLMPEQEKLAIGLVFHETREHVITVDVTFARTDAALERWRLRTYDLLLEAYNGQYLRYQEALADWRSRLAAAQAEVERSFGDSPSKNRLTIRKELKKHFLNLLTHAVFESRAVANAARPEDRPTIDVGQALFEGRTIRFLEQAFEWEQLQYVFYPYFWARSGTWSLRLEASSPDPEFREFLQSGSARLVLPVRPGYEAALAFFVQFGQPYLGGGEPRIGDPTYVSIVDEIRERADAPDEVPEGEPWDVRVPTDLVLLRRREPELPGWERDETEPWAWSSTTSE